MSGRLTPEKARKILRDGRIRGRPLTPAQKRFFGAIAGSAGGTVVAEKKWIQSAIRRPGRIRRLLGKKEGEKITMADLDRLEARAKGNRSLQAAINLARRFVSGQIGKAAEGAVVAGDSAFELIRRGYDELR